MQKKDKKIDTISIKIPHNLNKLLDTIAEKADRSKSSLIRTVINDYIEDYIDLRDGEEALREFERDGRQTITLEEIKEKYGI